MRRVNTSLSTLSDEEATIRYKRAKSLNTLFELHIQILNEKIAALDLEIVKEKVTYKKKLLREKLNEVYNERDDCIHKRNLILIEKDILEPENEF
jgi:hypothetical protein